MKKLDIDEFWNDMLPAYSAENDSYQAITDVGLSMLIDANNELVREVNELKEELREHRQFEHGQDN